MWEKLEGMPVLLIGTVLTQACARIGICWLLGIVSGPTRPPYSEAPAVATWTLSMPLTTRNPGEMLGLVRAFRRERDPVKIGASGQTLRITGVPPEVERLAHLVREIDQPATAGQRIWTVHVRGSAGALAESLEMLSKQRRCWPEEARISKIVPDDLTHRVIVVGNESGYQHLLRMHADGCPDPRLTDPISRPVQWWNPR